MAKKKKQKMISGTWIAIGVAIIAIIAIVFFALNIGKMVPKAQDTDVLATVNGEKITNEELNTEVDRYLASMPNTEDSQQLRDAILEQLMISRLVLQDAKNKGYTVTDQEANDLVTQMLTENNIPREEFLSNLESQNMTLDDFNKLFKEKVLITKYLNDTVLSNLQPTQPTEVTDADVQKYYGENKDDLVQVQVSHILVCYSSATRCTQNRTKADTLALARTIINNHVTDHAAFEDLASQYSDDASTKDDGGSLGWITKGMTVESFEVAAFKLKPGQVSTAPVESSYGYHIIKVEDKKDTFEQLKDDIKMQLENKRAQEVQQGNVMLQQQAIASLVNDLKSKASIVYLKNSTPEQLTQTEGTFKIKDGAVCEEDGKPVIRLYSTTTCPHCIWVKDVFDSAVKQYGDKIIAYHWQLDSGDNTLTEEKETGVPDSELAIYQQFNSGGSVPTFVFGCKYYRIGTGHEIDNDKDAEKAEFKQIIDQLLVN